jgi:hypothetical protein
VKLFVAANGVAAKIIFSNASVVATDFFLLQVELQLVFF